MNNEMDLLLRRLSRRQNGSMDAGSSISGEHLDADELSSYAENVLPAAARARYTEHLAECASCRDLVVQLSASAGVVVAADQKAKNPAASGWRSFLASLFSPMVLRYAVPALGLIVVAAIGFVLMNRESGFVALQSSSPNTEPAAESPASPGVFTYSNEADKTQDGRIASDSKAPAKTATKKESAEPPPPNMPPGVTINAEVKKAAPAEEQTGAGAAPVQQEPKPAPATGDFQVSIEARKQETQRQASDTAKVARERALDRALDQAQARDRRSDEVAGQRSGPARNEAPSAAPSSAARPGVVAPIRGATAAEKDKSDAETRTVAGRRFRREGGVWIDTAYNQGTSTVNLARGSEQYRALIADEPSIKTIADELEGQIIVVWKSRAYRIR